MLKEQMTKAVVLSSNIAGSSEIVMDEKKYILSVAQKQ